MIVAAASIAPKARRAVYRNAMQKYANSAEAPLRLAEDLIVSGSHKEAEKLLAGIETKNPFDWRVSWYRGGRCWRRAGRRSRSVVRQSLSRTSRRTGSETRPGARFRTGGRPQNGSKFYDIVSRTDPNFTTPRSGWRAAWQRPEIATARSPRTSACRPRPASSRRRRWRWRAR